MKLNYTFTSCCIRHHIFYQDGNVFSLGSDTAWNWQLELNSCMGPGSMNYWTIWWFLHVCYSPDSKKRKRNITDMCAVVIIDWHRIHVVWSEFSLLIHFLLAWKWDDQLLDISNFSGLQPPSISPAAPKQVISYIFFLIFSLLYLLIRCSHRNMHYFYS